MNPQTVIFTLVALWLTGCGWTNIEQLVAHDGSVETDKVAELDTRADTSVNSDTDVAPDTGAATDLDTGTDLGADTGLDAGTSSDSDSDTDSGTDTDSFADSDSDTAADLDTGTDTEPDTDTHAVTTSDSESSTEAASDSDAGSDTLSDSTSDIDSDTDTGTETGTEIETQTVNDTETATATDTGSEVATETQTATIMDTGTGDDTGTASDSATDTGTAAVADLTRGYWLLDAVDGAGVSWRNSTVLLSEASTNPDGTVSMTARFDWFEEQIPRDTNIGTATYTPATATLQVAAVTGSTMYDYQATYEESTDSLIDGSWTPGAGVFTAARQLDGFRLAVSDAQATTQHSAVYRAAMIFDETHTYYWSTARGEIAGQTITIDLAAPASLRAVRLFSYRVDTTYAPPTEVTIRCYDASDLLITTVPLTFAESTVYQGRDLVVSEPVARLEMDIVEVVNPAGEWLIIHEMDLFGGL